VTSYVLLRSKHLRGWFRDNEDDGGSSSSSALLLPLLLPLAYRNLSELASCGPLVALWSRRFEREMGSRQLAKLVLCLVFAVAWLRRAAEAAASWTAIVMVSARNDAGGGSGAANAADGAPPPSSFRFLDAYLGALLWLFHSCTPRVHPRFVSLLGGRLTGSEKVLYYGWFLYALWTATAAASSSYASSRPLAAVLAGAVVGAMFTSFLGRWAIVPDRLASWMAVRFGSWVEPPPRMLVPAFGGAGGGGGRYAPHRGLNPIAHQAAAAAAAAAAPPRAQAPAPVAADPGAVETLAGMGFDRRRAVRALEASGNDLQGAADRLLSGTA
jgi:hypothetical protein